MGKGHICAIDLTSATALWAGLMHRQSGSGGDLFIDDVAVYVSNVVDNTAPNSTGSFTINNTTTNSIDLNWSAAPGGVDNGGYLLVRYTSNPAAADDPNVNGIYAVGNAIPGTVTGTVVYQGAASSFTDATLTPATQYWYKLYTYDKAYNYSSEIVANGTTMAPFPFVNGDYRPSSTGLIFLPMVRGKSTTQVPGRQGKLLLKIFSLP